MFKSSQPVPLLPYEPNVIHFDGLIYGLTQKLDYPITLEEDRYIVRNDLLDLTVWGKTTEEAEAAFNFSFHSLYMNYALEEDAKLSDKANALKMRLLDLVKVRYEA